MSVRTVISAITVILLAVVLFSARHSLEHAWQLLGQVKVAALLLVVPVVLTSFFAAGEMIFSYLRQKHLIRHVNPLTLMRISLELNFVNHIMPSGGASGIAYVNWRLGKFGVPAARATMAQAVRYVAGFAAAIVLLLVSLLVVTIDGTVNRWLILMSAAIILTMVMGTFILIFALTSRQRIEKFASFITRTVNAIVRRATLGKKSAALNYNRVKKYFDELHEDYTELRHDIRLLKQPILWGILFVVMDVAMFWVTFWALGTYVNPATIIIAYHVATLAGFVVVTPGGVGAYEWLMVMVIVMSGVSQGEAIAGVVLARTIILLVTVVFGYIFYQEAIAKNGKSPTLDTGA